jgi:glutaredoxin 3
MNAEIFTKDACHFCTKAKALMNQFNIPFTEIDAVANKTDLIDRVVAATGLEPKTLPQIFIDGVHIGGHNHLVDFLKGKAA